MNRFLVRTGVAGLLALAATGCQRKENNPLVGTPGAGVTGVDPNVRGVDNRSLPDVKILIQPLTDAGANITDLTLGNFAILEDEKPVIPASFAPAIGYPLSVMIVLDHSGSMSGDSGGGVTYMEAAQAGIEAFLNTLSAGDEVAAIEYDSSVNFLSNFTTNKQAVIDAVYTSTPAGATATYDAIAEGAELMTQGSGLRLLIFLTDGVDTASTLDKNDVIAKLASVGLVACGVVITIAPPMEYVQITQSTGGDVFTGSTPVQIAAALNAIISSGIFDNMYALTFRRKTISPNIKVFVNYGPLTGSADLKNFR